MLGMLATEKGERTRSWLQEKLWGSRGEIQAQQSLRRELFQLRKILADCGNTLMYSDHSRVWLDRDIVDCDIDQTPLPAKGEFLEGIDISGAEDFEEWLRDQRNRIHKLRETLTQRYDSPLVSGTDVSVYRSAHTSRPTVAVLPFINSSGLQAYDDLADGIAEEVSISLSRFATLRVVAGTLGKSLRQHRHDLTRMSSELGVRYLVDGRISIANDVIRITARLEDCIQKTQVWSDRFNSPLDDIFSIQDEVATEVARHIDSSIEKEEMRRAIARPVETSDAYQLYWRANALFRQWTRPSVLEAIELCEQVKVLEPDNGWAHALSAFCRGIALSSGWQSDVAAARDAAIRDSDRALQLGADDPVCLGYVAGTLVAVGGDIQQAKRVIERASTLAPGFATVLFWHGWVDCCRGAFEEGLRQLVEALDLNPRSAVRPYQQTGIGLCLMALGRSEEALPMLTDAVFRLPEYPATLAGLACVQAKLGRMSEAVAMLDRLDAIDPNGLTLTLFRDHNSRTDWARMLSLVRDFRISSHTRPQSDKALP